MFNYDESNFRDNPQAEQAFFGGGCKYFEASMNSSKVAYSVMFCCSADGTLLPPMVVYKSLNGNLFKQWCEGGPDKSVYSANKSGWFNMDQFNEWFRQARMLFQIKKRNLPI